MRSSNLSILRSCLREQRHFATEPPKALRSPLFPLLPMRLSCLFLVCTLLSSGALLLSGCLRDQCQSTLTYVRFDPIYAMPEDFRNTTVKAEAPRPLRKPGKIYFMGNYLLINERNEGIHVFDNSDPYRPIPVVFWKIPGNVDMAMRGHYLYADQYVDLLALDVSDVHQPKTICRRQDVFSLLGYRPGKGYFVGYQETQITETIDCENPNYGKEWYWCGDYSVAIKETSLPGAIGNGSLPTGIAGSFARFGQWGDYLYCVDNQRLHSFSTANPACPALLQSQHVGWNIETIFPWKNRLFIGSNNAVHIFQLSNPTLPTREATFSHTTGCDPVVCDEENAYVTLHAGTSCNGTLNQLDVLDIRYLPHVSLVRTYPMTKPLGLAVTPHLLFLCDDGLKIFDKTNPKELKLLNHVRDLDTYDVIALTPKHLLVIGREGFFQYDVSDPHHPRLMSCIRR